MHTLIKISLVSLAASTTNTLFDFRPLLALVHTESRILTISAGLPVATAAALPYARTELVFASTDARERKTL